MHLFNTAMSRMYLLFMNGTVYTLDSWHVSNNLAEHTLKKGSKVSLNLLKRIRQYVCEYCMHSLVHGHTMRSYKKTFPSSHNGQFRIYVNVGIPEEW